MYFWQSWKTIWILNLIICMSGFVLTNCLWMSKKPLHDFRTIKNEYKLDFGFVTGKARGRTPCFTLPLHNTRLFMPPRLALLYNACVNSFFYESKAHIFRHLCRHIQVICINAPNIWNIDDCYGTSVEILHLIAILIIIISIYSIQLTDILFVCAQERRHFTLAHLLVKW